LPENQYPDFCICNRIVHLYRRRTDGALVILKEIPVEQMSRDDRLAAQNECQVLKLLSHPNSVILISVFICLCMIIVGGTLADNMQKCCNSLLDEDMVLHFFVQILLALYHNILLDKHQMIVKIGYSARAKPTVVGTPCYISPELCEGKPYKQKSDIWALGCVLYELASLKRAFEAANLPALVLKIMSGTFAPISDRYSPELRQLILNVLNLDPSKRPQLNDIMAHPICIRPLLNLYTDIHRQRQNAQVGLYYFNWTFLPYFLSNYCFLVPFVSLGGLSSLSSTKMMHPLPLSSVHFQSSASAAHVKHRGYSSVPGSHPEDGHHQIWAAHHMGGVMIILFLIEYKYCFISVFSVYFGLTLCQAPSVGSGEPTLPGAVEQMQPQFISRFLEGQSGVMIKSVSCGDLFTTCLSGMLLTIQNFQCRSQHIVVTSDFSIHNVT
uniref:Protein kinase domain-containing protein n=1 Tax=Cyprinus carpio TaxID=7962 RepID=A0A8C1SKJ5_CYPCA